MDVAVNSTCLHTDLLDRASVVVYADRLWSIGDGHGLALALLVSSQPPQPVQYPLQERQIWRGGSSNCPGDCGFLVLGIDFVFPRGSAWRVVERADMRQELCG
jgi:hypothetical protein